MRCKAIVREDEFDLRLWTFVYNFMRSLTATVSLVAFVLAFAGACVLYWGGVLHPSTLAVGITATAVGFGIVVLLGLHLVANHRVVQAYQETTVVLVPLIVFDIWWAMLHEQGFRGGRERTRAERYLESRVELMYNIDIGLAIRTNVYMQHDFVRQQLAAQVEAYAYQYA